MNLFLIGRCSQKLNDLSKQYGNFETIQIDFYKTEDIKTKMNDFIDNTEYISGLCYAVGSIDLKSLKRSDPEDFIKSFRLNAVGATELIKCTEPLLKKKILY